MMKKFTRISNVLSSASQPAGTIGLGITCFQTQRRAMFFCKSYSTSFAPERRLKSFAPLTGNAYLGIREWLQWVERGLWANPRGE